jgi:ElaB/YqjD/DUF883 family membrane-anchored ribosome-binding protein
MDTATKRRSHASPVSRSDKADRLAADFQAFVGDVEQVLKSASQLPGDGLTAARSKLEEKVAQARAQLTDGVSEAREAGAAYLRERVAGYGIIGARRGIVPIFVDRGAPLAGQMRTPKPADLDPEPVLVKVKNALEHSPNRAPRHLHDERGGRSHHFRQRGRAA